MTRTRQWCRPPAAARVRTTASPLAAALRPGAAGPPSPAWLAAGGRGQALVEAALVFPVLLVSAIALVQFGLYAHAQQVVTAAAQEGARVAAAEDGRLQDGVAQAQALLQAGLGPSAGGVNLRSADDGQVVTLAASGRWRLAIPWSADASLPLSARAVVARERFRAGGA